jgi:hypothetical protein
MKMPSAETSSSFHWMFEAISESKRPSIQAFLNSELLKLSPEESFYKKCQNTL